MVQPLPCSLISQYNLSLRVLQPQLFAMPFAELEKLLKKYRDNPNSSLTLEEIKMECRQPTPVTADQLFTLLKKNNRSGETVIHCAARKGNHDIIKYLLDEHSRVSAHRTVTLLDMTNKKGLTPQAIATRAGYPEIEEYLRKRTKQATKPIGQGDEGMRIRYTHFNVAITGLNFLLLFYLSFYLHSSSSKT